MCVTKEVTPILLLPGNSLGSSLFLSKNKYPHFQPRKAWNRVAYHIVLTLINRLTGVTGNFSFYERTSGKRVVMATAQHVHFG